MNAKAVVLEITAAPTLPMLSLFIFPIHHPSYKNRVRRKQPIFPICKDVLKTLPLKGGRFLCGFLAKIVSITFLQFSARKHCKANIRDPAPGDFSSLIINMLVWSQLTKNPDSSELALFQERSTWYREEALSCLSHMDFYLPLPSAACRQKYWLLKACLQGTGVRRLC